MTQPECDEIMILELREDISKIIEKYSLISKSEIKKIVERSVLSENLSRDTHRWVLQWKDSSYRFKGKNVVFKPIKFVKLLLSISAVSENVDYVTVLSIFCDVLEIFSIKLSQDESVVLLFLYQLSSMMALNDENVYEYYLRYVTTHNCLRLDVKMFCNTLKKLLDDKLIFIDNGNYFVADRIIRIN